MAGCGPLLTTVYLPRISLGLPLQYSAVTSKYSLESNIPKNSNKFENIYCECTIVHRVPIFMVFMGEQGPEILFLFPKFDTKLTKF